MQIPLQISYRNMESSPAVDACIREEVDKLSEFYDRIIGCRVMVEIPHQHHQHGKRFHVRVDLTVPGGEIVVKHEPSLHTSAAQAEFERHTKGHETAGAHKDAYVALHDAFKTARRQLQDFARRQHGDVKRHANGMEKPEEV